MYYQFLPVERIHYGINVVSKQLVDEIENEKAKKVLFVTTNSVLKIKPLKRLLETLTANQYEIKIFTIKQHVPGEELFKNMSETKNFNPDLIISCGGGSAIDTGKIISLVLSEKISKEEALYPFSENRKEKKISMENAVPIFAIPTTLSAAEFTSIAGTTNSIDHIKYKFSHLKMTPKQVFLDPLFTIDTPEWLWLSTGIRAVDHAVETLYLPQPNAVNNSLALQALKNLYTYLPLSKQHPFNMEYRLNCQIGAWLSLFSVVNIRLGLSHSIGHQLGALFNIPHGMTSAIMLPAVMKFLLPRTYEEQVQITKVLEQYETTKSIRENAEKAPILIKNLIKRLELPHRLRDFNVKESDIDTVVANIMNDIESEKNEFVLETKGLREQITILLKEVW